MNVQEKEIAMVFGIALPNIRQRIANELTYLTDTATLIAWMKNMEQSKSEKSGTCESFTNFIFRYSEMSNGCHK